MLIFVIACISLAISKNMKYFSATLLFFLLTIDLFGQGGLPDTFLDGKSVVMISSAPQARPVLSWKELAEAIHPALVEAGGDPVAYYELEDVTLSEEVQTGFAEAFNKRLIKNIVILTRKANGELALNIAPYTMNKNMVPNAGVFSLQMPDLGGMVQALEALGKNSRSHNYLVLDVPEYPVAAGAIAGGTNRFLPRNPLNLDVFKLGVPLSGSAGESSFLTMYRYDLLGKSAEAIAVEQEAEKRGLEGIFKSNYPYQVEFLTEAKSEAELIRDRVQFVLMRVEGREGDLMKSMGLPVLDEEAASRIVVKYYIKFLVRNELYIGPTWDAHPNWRTALSQFLSNLQK